MDTSVTILISVLSIILVPTILIGIWYGISHACGWHTLSKIYIGGNSYKDSITQIVANSRVGIMNFGFLLLAGADQNGLHLAISFPLFKKIYPSLFIPWKDIEIKKGGNLFSGVYFGFKNISYPEIFFHNKTAYRLFKEGNINMEISNKFTAVKK